MLATGAGCGGGREAGAAYAVAPVASCLRASRLNVEDVEHEDAAAPAKATRIGEIEIEERADVDIQFYDSDEGARRIARRYGRGYILVRTRNVVILYDVPPPPALRRTVQRCLRSRRVGPA